jgi:hypothetical protein
MLSPARDTRMVGTLHDFCLSAYLWFLYYNYAFTNVFLFVPVLLIQSYQVYSTRRFWWWHGGMLSLEISVAFSFVSWYD